LESYSQNSDLSASYPEPAGFFLGKKCEQADKNRFLEGVPKVFVKGSSDSSYADTSGVLCWSG
jgi:hypothetical protein